MIPVMANFKTHISFGILTAFLLTAGIACCTRLLRPIQILVFFCMVLIGSAIPDVDSDNARPSQILFGILGIACPILFCPLLFPLEKLKMEELFCLMLVSFLFFQYFLAWLFFRFTRHRGIYHSIPAAILAGECVILLFQSSLWYHRLFYGGAIFAGYLLHLILDEIYAVDLFGMRLKKSAGTAVSLGHKSIVLTVLIWITVGMLTWICIRDLLTTV